MKLIREDIFPTSIYSTDGVLDKTSLQSIKTDIFNSYKKEPKTNWQSSPNLHEQEVYKPLVDKIIECSRRIFDGSKLVYSGFKITDMWSNVSKQGEFHRPHTHSNNYLSGVFYVQSDKSKTANIQFYDPRPQADIITPSVTESTRYNSHIWFYPSIENRMLFFPSWLQHYVPTNNSELPRSSIAFNLMFTGKVGHSQDLQSAEF
jgi:uncharacterized protein (TIGR02466 family)